MSTLISLIESIDDWQSKTDQQLHDALHAETIQYQDHELWTWAGVAETGGNACAEGLRIALEANNMGWAVHQLGGSGLDLSLAPIQAALSALWGNGAGVPDLDLVALAVKRMISPLEDAGITATLSQVSLAKSKRLKYLAAASRWNSYVPNLSAWNGDPNTEPTL
jgi:hypothetical protein